MAGHTRSIGRELDFKLGNKARSAIRQRAFSFSGRSPLRNTQSSDSCSENQFGRVVNKTKVQPIAKSVDVMEKGLPSNLDAERFVLGSVLLDDRRFIEVAALSPDDFSLERHRRIFGCMQDLQARSEHIDRVTVAEELASRNELGPDGLGYLASLDDGMPRIAHLDSYVRIVLDKSRLRRTIFTAQKLMNECLLEAAAPDEVLGSHLAEIQELSQSGSGAGQAIADLPPIRECGGTAVEYLRSPELPKGAVIAFTGDSGSGKSTLLLSWAAELSAVGTPVLILDRDNPISAIVERFDRLGIVDDRMLKYWGGWRPEQAPQPDDSEVVAWVKSCERWPLVIVDCMVAFHGGDENDAGETRAFMRRCRMLADLGATVVVIHHDGKADSAKDYRGSSDFKAAVDAAFHVSNFGVAGCLGLIRLRCYKSRFGFGGELIYRYVDGRFLSERDPDAPSRTVTEQLTELLRNHQGINANDFEALAVERGLGRNRARGYLKDGLHSAKIRQETGTNNTKHHYIAESDEC
jgi:hypothetical protein